MHHDIGAMVPEAVMASSMAHRNERMKHSRVISWIDIG